MKFMTKMLKFMARMLMKVTMAMTALKALRPPTRSRPSCFALRQCSHCHHQSLVMITMMIMTVMRSWTWQLWSFMMMRLSSVQDLFFFEPLSSLLNFSRNGNLDMHELLWNVNASMIFDAEEKEEYLVENHHRCQSFMIVFLSSHVNISRNYIG